MFATGIENSIPTIDNGRTRVDQMESCGHYKHWKLDFDCVEELGLRFLRYGPPLHRTYLGPGRYDWEFQTEPHLVKRLTITIETMLSLPADTAPAVFGWLTALPYPWTDPHRVMHTAPPIESLAPVLHWIRRDHPAHSTGGTA